MRMTRRASWSNALISEMKANDQLKALYANVKEMGYDPQPISGAFRDILVIAELRGSYPNVPISADVDYAALTQGDPESDLYHAAYRQGQRDQWQQTPL